VTFVDISVLILAFKQDTTLTYNTLQPDARRDSFGHVYALARLRVYTLRTEGWQQACEVFWLHWNVGCDWEGELP